MDWNWHRAPCLLSVKLHQRLPEKRRKAPAFRRGDISRALAVAFVLDSILPHLVGS